MSSPASVAKHPIHPMIVVFPVALWIFSFVCDLFYILGGDQDSAWATVSFYSMAGGIVGAVLAAVPGFIDWLSITDPRTKRIGLYHMLLNVTALILFAVNLWIRYSTETLTTLPIALSAITILILGISGWLGGELVYVYGVGVEPRGETNVKADRKTG